MVFTEEDKIFLKICARLKAMDNGNIWENVIGKDGKGLNWISF